MRYLTIAGDGVMIDSEERATLIAHEPGGGVKIVFTPFAQVPAPLAVFLCPDSIACNEVASVWRTRTKVGPISDALKMDWPCGAKIAGVAPSKVAVAPQGLVLVGGAQK